MMLWKKRVNNSFSETVAKQYKLYSLTKNRKLKKLILHKHVRPMEELMKGKHVFEPALQTPAVLLNHTKGKANCSTNTRQESNQYLS